MGNFISDPTIARKIPLDIYSANQPPARPLVNLPSTSPPAPNAPLPFAEPPAPLKLAPNLAPTPPPPSVASPPPTLATAGATATGIPTASPPTPLESVAQPKSIPASAVKLPSIAPIAGGAALVGVGDFGSRLADGQNVGDAAKGALYTTGGAFAGGAIGFAVAGPVGGLIGSQLGGMAASAIYDAAFPTTPEAAIAREAGAKQGPPPFEGGQVDGIRYRLELEGVLDRDPSNIAVAESYSAYGPIRGISDSATPTAAGKVQIISRGVQLVNNTSPTPPGLLTAYDTGVITSMGVNHRTWSIVSATPYDNSPDTGGNPPGGDPIPDKRNPGLRSAGGQLFPSALPSPGKSLQPGASPHWVPSAKPADKPGEASDRGGLLPFAEPAPRLNLAPNLAPSPLQSPIPGSANRGSATPLAPLAPSGAPAQLAATPSSSPVTVKATSTPTALKPVPPAEKTPEQVNEEVVKKLDDQAIQIAALGAAIATLIANPTALTPQAAKQAAAEGTCQTLQPQGCMRNEFDKVNNSNQANSNKLDELNAAMNAADLAGLGALSSKLDKIDNKLGPQIPNGGISGKLGSIFDKFAEVTDLIKDKFNKTWNALGLDRVVNLLTLAASIHNAAMVSRDLGETLVETAESVIRAAQAMIPGFLKNPDGENFEIDLSEIFGNQIESFLRETLGDDNYLELKATWIKANRILTASSNALSAMRGMSNAITDGLEVVGGYVAQGFNGIQKEGVVSDKTWAWMDESPQFKNQGITRFTERLENAEDAASSVQQIAQAPVEFVEESKELVEATTELKKTLDEDTKKKLEEEDKKDKESESPDVDDNDLLPGGGND